MPAPPGTSPTESALERLLREHAGLPVSVTLTRNRRRLVSVRRESAAIRVRLHEVLAAVSGPVQQALCRFVSEGCRASGKVLREHFSAVAPPSPPRPPRLNPHGRHHRLDELLRQVMTHFPGHPAPAVTWGPRRPPGRKQVRLGSYEARRRLIRVHPLLDHPSVPEAVVRHVLFHELLHHLLLPKGRGGDESAHGPRFRALESKSPDFAAARAWQRAHLPPRAAAARRGIW